jgi:hypothetical protein
VHSPVLRGLGVNTSLLLESVLEQEGDGIDGSDAEVKTRGRILISASEIEEVLKIEEDARILLAVAEAGELLSLNQGLTRGELDVSEDSGSCDQSGQRLRSALNEGGHRCKGEALTMADGSGEFSALVEVPNELLAGLVDGEIDDGSVATDVEDGVVVGDGDVAQLEGLVDVLLSLFVLDGLSGALSRIGVSKVLSATNPGRRPEQEEQEVMGWVDVPCP